MTACRPARRVRKFGRRGFAGESCRSPVDVTSGSRARRRARDGRSTFSPDRLKRQRRPAVRLRPRGAEHLLGREPHSRPGARALAVIGHSGGTARSHWQKLTHPLRMALCCPPLYQLAAEMPEATIQNFPGNRHDRIYEPYRACVRFPDRLADLFPKAVLGAANGVNRDRTRSL
jgi:hypothetical protein